ncbi:MAG: hypothetical protein QM754_16820 [Tepidisphaeraceae bacterium]
MNPIYRAILVAQAKGKSNCSSSTRAALPAAFILIILFGPEAQQARRQAKQIQCSTNLRKIGLAFQAYINADRNGDFPPDLPTLVVSQELSADVFLDPADPSRRTEVGPVNNWASKIVPGSDHCDYIYPYQSGWNQSINPKTIVLYEPLSSHNGDGINVVYADGEVNWLETGDASRVIASIQGGHNPP